MAVEVTDAIKPGVVSMRGPRWTRPSSKIVWATASSGAASVPGTIGSHPSARAAVAVRTGSITITLPRLRIPLISPITSGAASSEPCDAAGLAPMITSRSVRQPVSGVGRDRADPALFDHRSQQFGAAAKGRILADIPPLPVDFEHRLADAVRVVVQRGQRPTLGAQMPTAPHVVGVAADAGNPPVFDRISKPHIASQSGQVRTCLPSSPVFIRPTLFRYPR